ncbi:MAG: hypothetical protein ACOC91_03620 [bacterium]
MNQTTFARWCGVSRDTAARWVKDGLPHVRSASGRGVMIETGPALAWLRERAREEAAGADPAAAASRRYREARARKAELEAGQMAGRLVRQDVAANVFGEAMGRVGRCLAPLPAAARQIAGMKDERRIRLLLAKACRAALEAAHQTLKSYDAASPARSGRRRGKA